MIKRFFISLTFAIGLACSASAASGDLFPYPTPPDDIDNLYDRCDFIITRFWNPCDFKSAFSRQEVLNATFGDWVGFMPYAHADTVKVAIDRLLQRVRKHPKQMLGLARMAENWAYCDTAAIFSEDIYYPFAAAVAANNKISRVDRARFEQHVRIIDNARVGRPMQHLLWVDRQDNQCSIDDVRTQMVVVMFNNSDCDECALARVRLSADINAQTLIKAGVLTIVCLEPGDATEEWHTAAASFPDNWVVGASADADEWFALRQSPEIYLLDSRHKVLAKGFNIDGLLAALYQLRQTTGL